MSDTFIVQPPAGIDNTYILQSVFCVYCFLNVWNASFTLIRPYNAA